MKLSRVVGFSPIAWLVVSSTSPAQSILSSAGPLSNNAPPGVEATGSYSFQHGSIGGSSGEATVPGLAVVGSYYTIPRVAGGTMVPITANGPLPGYFPVPMSLPYQIPIQAGQVGPGGLMLPHPHGQMTTTRAVTHRTPPADPARATSYQELGDRAFRGSNYKKARERYLVAAKADSQSPSPHVRLAQVSLVRSDFAEAADHLRDAVSSTNGPGWLIDHADIQKLYVEPRDFARQIAKLESHLQKHPGDRDAWFVLGAEQHLSGRSKAASDIFLRLTDRQPDEALAAFLDAATIASRTTRP